MSNEPDKIIYSMIRVSKRHGQREVLKDISLSYFYGAKIGVLGLNGSGKSSLLKILAGVDQAFDGKTVLAPGYTIGYLEQEPLVSESRTVREVVEEGAKELVDLVKEFEEINARFAEPMEPDEMDKLNASATGATPTTVGEALLVEPGVESYEIEVAVKQEIDKDGNAMPEDKQTETYKLVLKASDVKKDGVPAGLTSFAASNSYNVTIAVYGVEKIELKAELGEWLDGGDIDLNPDDTFTE